MKKNIILMAMALAVAAFTVTGCDPAPKADDPTKNVGSQDDKAKVNKGIENATEPK